MKYDVSLKKLQQLFATYAMNCPQSQRIEPYDGYSKILNNSDLQAKTIYESFDIRKIIPGAFYVCFEEIKMRTRPMITLKNVYLKIQMSSWGLIDVKFLQENINYLGLSELNPLIHPHISEKVACLGGFLNEYIGLTQQHYGKFPQMVSLIGFCLSFLRKYNHSSCYLTRTAMLNLNLPIKAPNGTMYYFNNYTDIAKDALFSISRDVYEEDKTRLKELYFKHIDAIRNRYDELGVSDKLNGIGEPKHLSSYLEKTFSNLNYNAHHLRSAESLMRNDGNLPKFHKSGLSLSDKDKRLLRTIYDQIQNFIPSRPYTGLIKYIKLDYSWIIKLENSERLLSVDIDKLISLINKSQDKFYRDFNLKKEELVKVLDYIDYNLKKSYIEEINKRKEKIINELTKIEHTTEYEQQGSLFATEVS